MKFTTTNPSSDHSVDLPKALLQGMAADGNLFMPASLPVIPRAFVDNSRAMTLPEIAYVIADRFFGDELPSQVIKEIVYDAYAWPMPVKRLDQGLYVAEMFHGPTLAFKDTGAHFMARMLGRLSIKRNTKIHVITATTGNTGSAAANGFLGVPGVEVYVLFPKGIAGQQLEKQFTTLGRNIHALEVNGTIDNCHAMAAQAFADTQLRKSVNLTTANSTNIARLLPQVATYFYIASRLADPLKPGAEFDIAIPAGNLGNLTAAVMAKKMGLQHMNIIAAENANDYLTRLIATGTPPAHRSAIPTLAYAADKSRPTNLPRLMALAGNDLRLLRRIIKAKSVDDATIIAAVNRCHANHGYTVDPHGAMAYHALTARKDTNVPGVFMATAHPAKSLTAMAAITGRATELPLQLTSFMAKPDLRIPITPTYYALRAQIMANL